MKINKEQMKILAEKSDAELWAEIISLAKRHGYDLSGNTPRAEDLAKVRRALMGIEKISLGDAAKMLNNYKNKNKG